MAACIIHRGGLVPNPPLLSSLYHYRRSCKYSGFFLKQVVRVRVDSGLYLRIHKVRSGLHMHQQWRVTWVLLFALLLDMSDVV